MIMAGSHHGGRTHSGSFHSGGGSHRSSGGFRSSGGHSYHSHSYHRSSSHSLHSSASYSSPIPGGFSIFDEDEDFYYEIKDFAPFLVIGLALGIMYGLAKIKDGLVPGLNLVNLGMFTVSGIILRIISKNESYRYGSLNIIKRGKLDFSRGEIAHTPGYKPKPDNEDGTSWVANRRRHYYRIALYDKEFRKENAQKVYDTIKRTPFIIWTPTWVWILISIICFVGTFFFYEAVIPYFEKAIMSDEAFMFMDYLIFYLPAGLSVLSTIASVILHMFRDKVLYECANRVVIDNNAMMLRMKTEGFIMCKLSEKWYYNICPNCGADPADNLTTCDRCGTSLEADFVGGGKPTSFHRILVGAANQAEPANGNKQ